MARKPPPPPAPRVMASPFLPPLPAVALGDLGRVRFPAVSSSGLVTNAERDPRNNRPTVYGPSTYTKPPTAQRVGGPFYPRLARI